MEETTTKFYSWKVSIKPESPTPAQLKNVEYRGENIASIPEPRQSVSTSSTLTSSSLTMPLSRTGVPVDEESTQLVPNSPYGDTSDFDPNKTVIIDGIPDEMTDKHLFDNLHLATGVDEGKFTVQRRGSRALFRLVGKYKQGRY